VGIEDPVASQFILYEEDYFDLVRWDRIKAHTQDVLQAQRKEAGK
jgi:hypothetical protein